jgi:type I restriction enzyme S subunit
MSFSRYPEYKDSGVEWLGQLPSHWDVVQFKQFVDIQNGSDHKHVEQSEGYPVIGSGGAFAYASDYLYDGESVLLGRKGTIDKPLYINGRFWTVDTMYWTKINPLASGRFAYYSALNLPFDYYSTKTALPSMTKAALSSHLIGRPQLEEQKSIANFLDHETAKIDVLVTEQEKLIKLLKEKRQTVISHAVTKGLDPKVKMKDSGVKWLGEVPAHWSMIKVSRGFSNIGSGTTPPSDETEWYEGGTIPWITTGELREALITETQKYVTQKAMEKFTSLALHPKGSLAIAMYGATIGRLAILGIDAVTNQACCVLSGSTKIQINFSFYWFQAFKQSIIEIYATGGGQPNINQQIISSLKVSCPSIEEQDEITRFLDGEISNVNLMLSKIEKAIDLLNERRSALISEAVSGKIDVRSIYGN